MHDVELPAGLTREHVRERTLAAWDRYAAGLWTHPFLVAAVFLAVELPPCPLPEWLTAADALSVVADGPWPAERTGEYEVVA